MKLLNIENISKNYGDKAILENVSCEIESGEIIGLLGLNGQGKSTFVKIILDLLNKDSGHIDRFLSLKKNLGVMLQEVSLPEHLKVKELIELIRKFSDNPRTVKDALDMMDLGGFANYDCGKLSGGQKRKLQFSVAITNNPSFLVLDEPTARMDIVSKELFWTNIKKMLKMQNLTVLLISHDLLEVESVTSRIIILNNKKIVVDKKMIDLKEEFNQTKIYTISKSDLIEDDLSILSKIPNLSEDADRIYIKMSPQGKDKIYKLFEKNFDFEKISIKTTDLSQYFKEVVRE